jgi:hypothetical protein
MPKWAVPMDATNIGELIIGLLLVIPMTSVLSLVVGFLTWKLLLGSKPLRVGGSALVFVVSALSTIGIFAPGHPFPAVLVFFALPEYWATAVIWMFLVGGAIMCLFIWWSRRRS